MFKKAIRQRAAKRCRPQLEWMEERQLLSGAQPDLSQSPQVAAAVDNTLLVRFRPGADQASALNALGAHITQQYPNGSEVIALAAGVSPTAAAAQLNSYPGIVYAEPDSVVHVSGDVVPNDPQFPQLWGLSNTNGTSIDAPQAWGITTGAPVVVAVIDSGIDLRNPDLVSQLWTNPKPTLGNRSDVHGWNYVRNSGNVQDDNGHGTHVSGILAAAGNNAYGVVGVNWNAKIMALKFLDASGNGSTDDAVSAIYYAVAHGAKVINASWGGPGYSQTLHDAIAYAAANNVVFVTAAGNDSLNNDSSASYPGNYRLPNELSVAAIDQFGNLADFSNWGPSTVDIAAPGVDIVSTIPGGFASYSGTSMSTPYVAGVASLVLSTHPQFSASQVVSAIVSSAKPLSSLAGMVISGGTVSAYRALTIGVNNVLGIPNTPPAPITYTSDQIEGFILGSNEFWTRVGSTNSGFVTALYHSLLGRDPDAGGFAYWTNQLNAGSTRTQVIQGFQSSPEAAKTKVARWYNTYYGLKQSLDSLKSNPYVISWAQLLMTGGTNESLQASLISSSTYSTLHGGTITGVVSGWYNEVMGRPADAQGLAAWSNLLANSSNPFDVARAFQAENESKAAEVARMYQVDLGRGGSLDSLKQDPGVVYWSSQLRI